MLQELPRTFPNSAAGIGHSGPGKGCLEDIYNDDGNSGQVPREEIKNDGSWGGREGDSGKETTLGTHPRHPRGGATH